MRLHPYDNFDITPVFVSPSARETLLAAVFGGDQTFRLSLYPEDTAKEYGLGECIVMAERDFLEETLQKCLSLGEAVQWSWDIGEGNPPAVRVYVVRTYPDHPEYYDVGVHTCWRRGFRFVFRGSQSEPDPTPPMLHTSWVTLQTLAAYSI